MKKVAVVLTNVDHYGDSQEPTGLWLSEATEFVNALDAKGVEVDYLSPAGGEVPLDPRSLKESYVSEDDHMLWDSEDFQRRALRESLPVEQTDAADYEGIYYTGGHGVMWDFPDDKALQRLAEDIYGNGGYVMSVCHGVCGLLNLTAPNGAPLISGKKITGFTRLEEILSGKYFKVPFITETEVRHRNAEFVQRRPYAEHALRDGQFITGQNPMSGGAVGRLFLDAIRA